MKRKRIDDLNLPAIDAGPGDPEPLSMDDYVKFVNFIADNFGNWKISREREAEMRVDAPFSIK